MATTLAQRELRRPPGLRTSVRQQVWLLGASRRWLHLTLGLLAILLWAYLAGPGLAEGPSPGAALVFTAWLALVAGVVWPIMVWHGESPTGRGYHWSLPIPRPAHDLTRVAVGALYLICVCAALAGAGVIAEYVDGTSEVMPLEVFSTLFGPQAWPYFFVPPLGIYFLTMPAVLWSEYPITRWTLGGWVAFSFLALALQSQGFDRLTGILEAVFSSERWGLSAAVITPLHLGLAGDEATGERWWTAAALWLAIGVGLTLFTAIYRPADLNRLFRGDATAAPAGA